MREMISDHQKNDLPLVTAVITTLNRPELLCRAVQSALRQTYSRMEVIVVVDGQGHRQTEEMLASILDGRLRVIVNEQNVGLAEARNVGARNARGEWIALLDDDDEWLPEKIEKQLAVARKLNGEYVFVVSRYIEKTLEMERTLPDALPRSTQNFSDYLFCKRGINLQSSTLFISKALLLKIPFTKGLKYVEDRDWLLRATADEQTKIGVVEEPLSVYNNLDVGVRESVIGSWETLYLWGMANRKLFSPMAFSFFMVTHCVARARQNRASFRIQLHLLMTALLLGSLSPKPILYFVGYSLIPEPRRRAIRKWIG
jgi:glycosyltransferase involved in cell wall biosynthesis